VVKVKNIIRYVNHIHVGKTINVVKNTIPNTNFNRINFVFCQKVRNPVTATRHESNLRQS